MNRIATFEEALFLKKNGAPQPEMSRGQYWYTKSGILNIVGGTPFKLVLFDINNGVVWRSRYLDAEKDLIFAPWVTSV